jgi:hypothetical protein
MIENTKQPLNVPYRVFKADSLEAAIAEAQKRGFSTENGYWWNNHLYLPAGEPLAHPVTEGEDY